MNKLLLAGILIASAHATSVAQGLSSKAAITYEELYDDPYAINKLFLHLQPMYAELSATNVTAGFGIGANYYLEDKADFHASFRQAYTQTFDLARDAAVKNQIVVNEPNNFTYGEVGFTYHIQDFEDDGDTKLPLYSRKYAKGNRWAAHMPDNIVIPTKVRKVRGVRLGGFAFDTSLDLKRIAEAQTVVLEDELGVFPQGAYVHTNQIVRGGFIGGSMSWFRNMAIKPDKGYSILSSSALLTTFADFMYAPSVEMEDVLYRDPTQGGTLRTFSVEQIETKAWGYRLGIEGKTNRTIGWAYGAEVGSRPGVKGKGFFAVIKISLPVYSTSLNSRREAFGK
ncbi:MAG: hypothetical protein WA958_01700 [Tunicatimonas sp.]